jgi:hypothetical protein
MSKTPHDPLFSELLNLFAAGEILNGIGKNQRENQLFLSYWKKLELIILSNLC